MLPPPGYNLETLIDIAESVEEKVKPLWASETGVKSVEGQPPKIQNFFLCSDSRRENTIWSKCC